MRLYWILAVSVVIACGEAFSAPETGDFSRYEVILRRRPFGAPPDRGPAPPVPQKPAEDPFKNYRLVGITRGDDDDISVGVVDIGANPPQSIFLTSGRSDQDLTLVDADFELEGALIRKGNDEKWLYLGGSAGVAGGGGVVSSAQGDAGRDASERSAGVQSYIDRMRARRDAAVSRPVEAPKYSGAELEQHLRDYNMDLIRAAAKGETKGPPLPIPLTPEEDKQLVEEGVLPPQE